jgi:hypothetical protein
MLDIWKEQQTMFKVIALFNSVVQFKFVSLSSPKQKPYSERNIGSTKC